jgi:hypothetical protein
MIRPRRTSRPLRPALVASVLLASLALTTPARAQNTGDRAAAEALYNDAKKLIADKRFADACPKLEESMRLDPGIGIMLHLASCYEKTNKTASAWALFREAEQLATRENDKRSDIAKKRADALESTLHRLTIVVPQASALSGLEVKRDGSRVGAGQWGTAVPVDPGEHAIAATAPGKIAWSTSVKTPLAKGDTSVTVPTLVDAPVPVVIADTAAPAPATTALPPAPPASGASAPTSDRSVALTPPAADTASDASTGRGTRIAGLALIGAGVVGVGIGSYFGIHTKSKLDESNADGHCRTDNHCDAIGAGLRSDAQSAGTASTVAFSLGLLGVAGGAIVYFTAPKPSASARAAHTPRTPLTVVVPAIGAGGGGLIVRGSF